MPTIAQRHHVHGDVCQKKLQLNLPTRGVSTSPLHRFMESPRTPNSFLAAQSPLDAYFDGPQHPSFHLEPSLEPECSPTIVNPTLLKSLRHSCSSSAQKEEISKQIMHVMVDRTNGHLMFPLKPKQGSSVKGHVWSLSQDADGCREVQEAFDEAVSEQDRVLLAMELVGHVREAVECPHANHVLRKCITTMLPSSVQFVIDEFVKGGAEAMREAARHRYGCRILEALMNKCSVEQMRGLVHYSLNDSLALMTHMYGNFIVQRLLEHGTQEHRHFLCAVIQMNILVVATNFYGAVVVGSALTYGARDDQLLLARTIIGVNGLLRSLMRFRHGEIVKQRLFEILEPSDYLLARYELQAAPLKVSRNMQHPLDRKLPNLVADVQVRNHRSRRQAVTKM